MLTYLRRCAGLAVCLAIAIPAPAQHRVAPQHLYERVIAIVPIVGTGTWSDPKRPMFAPVTADPSSAKGILAFQHEVSDDGQFAITEFVARDRAALQAILTTTVPGVVAFERGKHSRAEIEAAIHRFKKDFDVNRFGVRPR